MEKCQICGKECKSLSRHTWKAHGKGKDHKPFSGKTHSPEAIEKVRKSRTGKSSGMLGKSGLSVPHTEEAKKKISNSMKGNRNANHRGDRQSFYRDIRMDSSWEVKTARYLDEKELDWKYSYKSFILSDGRHYYPDFFVFSNGNIDRIIEVKGYFREENKKKFNMFLDEYPELVVELWDKPRLKELGIL